MRLTTVCTLDVGVKDCWLVALRFLLMYFGGCRTDLWEFVASGPRRAKASDYLTALVDQYTLRN